VNEDQEGGYLLGTEYTDGGSGVLWNSSKKFRVCPVRRQESGGSSGKTKKELQEPGDYKDSSKPLSPR